MKVQITPLSLNPEDKLFQDSIDLWQKMIALSFSIPSRRQSMVEVIAELLRLADDWHKQEIK